MAVQDDIAAERQRVTERLARIDAERQKPADQIAELDAAERVLSRMTPGGKATAPRRGRTRTDAAATAGAPAKAPARRPRPDQEGEATAPIRGQRARAGRRGGKRAAKPELSLGDATLRAVEALRGAVSAEQIREYLEREFGMQVRPNHLGMALQRHRRAGRLHEEDGRWAMQAQPAGADVEV